MLKFDVLEHTAECLECLLELAGFDCAIPIEIEMFEDFLDCLALVI
jgi:hypothetical protein